jgi:uncharacterized damage-inducible protein DinB
MSKLQLLRRLYAYNESANERILRAAEGLPAEDLQSDWGAGGGIQRTMAHVAGAQIVWLQRWTSGSNSVSVAELSKTVDMAGVEALFRRSHDELREYVAALTEEDVERVLTYRDSRGNEYSVPLWVLMTHVVNHGTQHRSEAAMMLTNLGRSPGELDYVFWELTNPQ